VRYFYLIIICFILSSCATYSNDSFTLVGNPRMRVSYAQHIYNDFPVEFAFSGYERRYITLRLEGYHTMRLYFSHSARGWKVGSVLMQSLPASIFVSSDNGQVYGYNARITSHLLTTHSVEVEPKPGHMIVSLMPGKLPVGTPLAQLIAK
jgi:hypothetical protein